jgi:hypothetical protein
MDCRAFPNFNFFYRVPRGEECGEEAEKKQGRKNGGHFFIKLTFIGSLEGNMLYLISILVVEYLDCQYRWEFRTSNPNLMRYVGIKFVLLLCTWTVTWFALWAIFELY